MLKLRTPFLIFCAGLVLLLSIIFVAASPISKYLIEKYDVKFIGREVTLQNIYVNLFTGCVRLDSLKIYETDGDSLFLSAERLSVNIAMLKLITKTYEISDVSVQGLKGTIIRRKKAMNFDDLIKRFSSTGTDEKAHPAVHFSVLGIKISNSVFYLRDENIPVVYFIKDVNVESSGKRWYADTIATHFSFNSGSGTGGIKGDITVNLESMNYRLAVAVRKFNLDIIRQYLRQLTNEANFSAHLDADVKATGSFRDATNLAANGTIVINDFHFGKSAEEDFLSFKKLALSIHELNPKLRKYDCDSVSLDRPFFKYEKYDVLNNLDVMFGKKGEKIRSAASDPDKFNLVIEIANYVKLVSKNFFDSDYKIKRLAIYDGAIDFNDYSENEKFSMQIANTTILADSIERIRQRVNISIGTNIVPYGKGSMLLSIDPLSSGNFDLAFSIDDLPITMFNPYIISHTSFPLDRGTVQVDGQWAVKAGVIKSENHLLIIDPRFAGRLRNKDLSWLPVKLIMPFVRERGNVIEYSLPITGDMKDPRFHLQDIFFHVLENALVNPVTTRYRMRIKNRESSIEQAMTLKWGTGKKTLERKQERSIAHMRQFLEKNPGASITVTPQFYAAKEMEYILFFQAKSRYYLQARGRTGKHLTVPDLSRIEKMSIKDSMFIQYLNKHSGAEGLHTVQEKCSQFVDASLVDSEYELLNKERAANFLEHFPDKGLAQRIKFVGAEDVVPYNGFSFYQFTYEGGNPEFLLAANHLIDRSNSVAPRKEFRDRRAKIVKTSGQLRRVNITNNTKGENK
jgi:hypothetical protein